MTPIPPFSLYVVTWNVAQKYPEYITLNDLLDIDFNFKDKELPDVFIIGFQEVNANPQNVVTSFFKSDPWVQKLKDLLKPLEYLVAKTEQMQGLLLTIFVKRKHLYHIREIESEYTKTGFGGMWVSVVWLRKCQQTGFSRQLVGDNTCMLATHF